ncbi:MAG: flagellar basal body L-ring protein FlgH [Candidatus Thiodiazotropha sp. (ex Rostrolucina anterorostrata)]|nr:flagellar basal body L-ring protein FlgH [Candidatus Thiodiazotropha sp. (ex Rostrolucina anterorostrata)]
MNRHLLVALMIGLAALPASGESLFNEATYQPLIRDHRARNIGQLLTVLIYESASSTTSADSDTNNALDVSINTGYDDTQNDATLGVGNGSSGGGTIKRTGRLMASVSVTIEKILDNGEMVVKGEQSIEFNNENQFIHVEGRVRPEDISSDNTVRSTRLADAKIRYVGEGLLGRSQEPGVITKFFNWIF